MLEKELKTWKENKSELVKLHLGKFVLIKGSIVVSILDTQMDAIKTGIDKFGNEAFLVKKIAEFEQEQNYTSTLIKCGA